MPVVQTLHNYRMFCANGLLNRGGEPCERCVGSNPLPALAHACYRGSRVATAGMLLGGSFIARDAPTRPRLSDTSSSPNSRAKFIAHGLAAERIVVRGNSLPYDPGAGAGAGGYALYAGRLTAEKGVSTLVRAWKALPDIPLRIAGDGELRATLEREAAGLPIEFLGRIPAERVIEQMQGADMLVVPSECYEGFPRVVVEAFATGTPIVAADLGGLRELVDERAGIRSLGGRARAGGRRHATVARSGATRPSAAGEPAPLRTRIFSGECAGFTRERVPRSRSWRPRVARDSRQRFADEYALRRAGHAFPV